MNDTSCIEDYEVSVRNSKLNFIVLEHFVLS